MKSWTGEGTRTRGRRKGQLGKYFAREQHPTSSGEKKKKKKAYARLLRVDKLKKVAIGRDLHGDPAQT
jgi:hypothetical protein